MAERRLTSLLNAGSPADASDSDVAQTQETDDVQDEVLDSLSEEDTPVAASGRRRRVASPDLEVLTTPVVVEPLEQVTFESWDAFEVAYREYCDRTYQPFRIATSTPSRKRNDKIRQTVLEKNGVPELYQHQLVPERFAFYNKAINCTHSGKPRTRGSGVRPNQRSRAINCPARIRLCVRLVPGRGWRVCITEQVTKHNHIVSEEVYRLYPSNRRVTDERVLEIVAAMAKYGTPRQGIRDFIRDRTGTAIGSKDFTNLLARLKEPGPQPVQEETQDRSGTDSSN